MPGLFLLPALCITLNPTFAFWITLNHVYNVNFPTVWFEEHFYAELVNSKVLHAEVYVSMQKIKKETEK